MRRALATVCLAVVAGGVAIVPGVPASAAPIGQRAYDASALAVPLNPEAGSHDSPIPARLYTTRADISNPPRAASARAARTDLGLLEQFTPPQALGPAADASTRDRGSHHNARTTDGDAVYTAHADNTPDAGATAVGAGTSSTGALVGDFRSTSVSRRIRNRIVATTETTMSGLRVGPVSFGTATYRASASTTGRPGGAHASGRVTMSDATVAGVPVVVTQDGVQVDSTRVPASGLDQAAAAIAAAFARSGYFDVRAVQPQSSATPDGSSASVAGGGIELVGRSDSNQTYFIATTVLSGAAAVDVGESLGDLHLPITTPPSAPPAPSTAGGLGPPYTPGPKGGGSVTGSAAAAPQVAPLFTSQASEVDLPHIWTGWPVLLGVAMALLLLGLALRLPMAAPLRRGLTSAAAAASDRYLRG